MKKAVTVLNMVKTGQKINEVIKDSGYTVRELQEILHLECPQPVYRWYKGMVLPSVDHLFILSKVLNMHMEDLLVEKEIKEEVKIPERKKSIWD